MNPERTAWGIAQVLRGHDIGDAMDRLLEQRAWKESQGSRGSAEQAPRKDK